MIEDRHIVTMEDWKSHMCFRLVPITMTLTDLMSVTRIYIFFRSYRVQKRMKTHTVNGKLIQSLWILATYLLCIHSQGE